MASRSPAPTVSARALLPVVGFASRLRPEAPSLWQQVGLDPSVAANPDERYLRFAQPATQVVFPARVLTLPLHGADPTLGAVLLRHAEELLAKQPRQAETWADRVRGLVYERFSREEIRLETLAKQLGVSARSLQRRLSDEGTSLAAIEDEVRQALARRYVADPTLGLAEVAYLLNFRDLSGLYRAFRRWTGKTPVEYRREHAPAHPIGP